MSLSATRRPAVSLLLNRLPAEERQRLIQLMKPVTLEFRQVLYDFQEPIEHVYFPTCGAASAVTVMSDGSAIEVATIGNEGVTGMSALHGSESSPNKVFMQVAGAALRMDLALLRQEARPKSSLAELLAKYQTAFSSGVSQSVACNGLHQVPQRCARWILMTHDRVQTDDIPLTHEFLGVMLGVRRSSITDVLKPLHDQGMIQNGRGVITVLDRKKLEATACECYAKVTAEFERLLGPPA